MNKIDVTATQAKAILARRNRFDTLAEFRPTEQQEEVVRKMERDDLLEALIGGGNRSGKSVLATAIFASFALNRPLIFRDGSEHLMRPERCRSEAVKIWSVSYDFRHIGKTLFRLLLQPGLYRIIRDQRTGKWRAWDPLKPGEDKQFHNTRKAPPIIRMEEIVGGEDGIAWEDKKKHQITGFTLTHDGTQLEFFPSTGSRPQGDPADLIWIDEKIDDDGWYNELLMRTVDTRGRIMWTAWPDTAPSAAMSGLEDRARSQAQSDPENQYSFHFVLKGSENPFTQSRHRDRIVGTMDEDERLARDEGVMNKDRWRVYARFSKFVHRAYGPDPEKDDALAKAIRAINGIPANWTRYLILDPGTVNPAVLLVAVPPPAFGDFIVPYDELYLHYKPAKEIAMATKEKVAGTNFEDWIIDSHAARQTPMGFDGTVGENYEKEFAAVGLRNNRHGSRFSFGSDNILRRIMGVQGTLNMRENGPRLRILGCPKLCEQLELCKWGKDPKGNPTDKPAEHQKIDVVHALEYFVSRDDCGYVPPKVVPLDDPRSRESVMKQMNEIFGIKPQTPSRSVLCGAGT